MFWIEISEGKNKPKEGKCSETEFEKEHGSKIAVLVVRMKKLLRGSSRAVMIHSDFSCVPYVLRLKENGSHETTVIKKKKIGPNTQELRKFFMKCKEKRWE